MRHIAKGKTPEALLAWKARNKVAPNYRYDELPGEVKAATKLCLLREQGWLCGYTGIALTEETSHIEHFKPQSLCGPGEDVDYHNLLAAYPGKDSAGNAGAGYGAPFKADRFDAALLISPWAQKCEERFRFDKTGKIEPANLQDAAASHTIKELGLDHKRLISLRRTAIEAFTADPLHRRSLAELNRLLVGLDKPDANGRLRQFCFALKQAMISVLAKAEKRRQQRIYAQRQPPSH